MKHIILLKLHFYSCVLKLLNIGTRICLFQLGVKCAHMDTYNVVYAILYYGLFFGVKLCSSEHIIK